MLIAHKFSGPQQKNDNNLIKSIIGSSYKLMTAHFEILRSDLISYTGLIPISENSGPLNINS